MTTYTWTDNMMRSGSSCDVDKVADNLMHLKYENPKATRFSINSGNTTNGDADILYAPGIGTAYAPWTRPNLTANGTPGGSDYACWLNFTPSNPAYKAFDGSTSYNTGASGSKASTSDTWKYGFYSPVPLLVSQLGFVTRTYTGDAFDFVPTSFQVLGSNDGVNYTVIGTGTHPTSYTEGETVYCNCSTSTAYKYIVWETLTQTAYWNVGDNRPLENWCTELNITAQQQVSVSTATTLYFKTGGTYPNTLITYADNSQENLENLPSIENLSTNGTYTIIKEKGQNPVAVLSAKVTQGKIFPSSPTDGNYHCLTATGLQTYKRVSGAWVETQYVPLGSFTVSSNAIQTVVQPKINDNGYIINKSAIANCAMPSSNYIDISLTSSYTAPADGYLVFGINCTAAGQRVGLFTDVMSTQAYSSGNMTPVVFLPVKRDSITAIVYDSTGALWHLRFYYAEGSKS